mgnify:CR=1 FL=1
MNLFIDNKSGAPIYEQLYTQIKNQILSGELQPEEAMPSIRGLARDLRISVITTKLKKIEAHLTEAVRLAAPCGLTKQELTEMLELLWEE